MVFDVRSLTPAQCVDDGAGRLMFMLGRAKTGKAAVATLTQWSQTILQEYVTGFGVEIIDNTPIFRTRGGKPVARKGRTGQWGGDHGGGRHITPRPYTKNSLVSETSYSPKNGNPLTH